MRFKEWLQKEDHDLNGGMFSIDPGYDQGLHRPQNWRPPIQIRFKTKADKRFGRKRGIPQNRKRR